MHEWPHDLLKLRVLENYETAKIENGTNDGQKTRVILNIKILKRNLLNIR